MSPEHITGRINVNEKSDVFSLGIVLYEALTLQCPYPPGSLEALFRRIVTKPMPPLRRKNPGVPRELEAIVHKAIAKDPDTRYESGSPFADDLARFLAGQPVDAPPYRYEEDWSEIAASRPIRMTIAALLFFFLAPLCVLMTLATLTSPGPPAAAGYAAPLTFAVLAIVGIVSFGTGRGLLRANRVALVLAPLTAAAVALISLPILAAGLREQPKNYFSLTMFSLIVLACAFSIFSVVSKRARAWARMARNIRAREHPVNHTDPSPSGTGNTSTPSRTPSGPNPRTPAGNPRR